MGWSVISSAPPGSPLHVVLATCARELLDGVAQHRARHLSPRAIQEGLLARQIRLPTSRSIHPTALCIRSCESPSNTSASFNVSENSPARMKAKVAMMAMRRSPQHGGAREVRQQRLELRVVEQVRADQSGRHQVHQIPVVHAREVLAAEDEEATPLKCLRPLEALHEDEEAGEPMLVHLVTQQGSQRLQGQLPMSPGDPPLLGHRHAPGTRRPPRSRRDLS